MLNIVGCCIGIVLLVVGAIVTTYALTCKKIKIYNSNQELRSQKVQLTQDVAAIKETRAKLKERVEWQEKRFTELRTAIASLGEDREKIQEQIEQQFEHEKELKVCQFETELNKVREQYLEKELELKQKEQDLENRIAQLQQTYAAAIEAEQKKEEVKTQTLALTNAELADVHFLNSIKMKLSQPRTVSMIIWTAYYKSVMDKLCKQLIGVAAKSGIYRITNIITNECYVGQSVDLAKRLKEHAKCGLGIDTPVNNKLYAAMLQYGLENFSWEVLEFCSKEELDVKEKFYIDLYKAKDYGYNATAGNGNNKLIK